MDLRPLVWRRFKQWSGGASGTEPNTTIEMTGVKTVTGHFIQQHTVTTVAVNYGETSPSSTTRDHGASAQFTWEDEPFCFCQFSHWAGLPEDQFPDGPLGPGTHGSETVTVTVNDDYHFDGIAESTIVWLTTAVDSDGCTGCAVDPAGSQWYIRDNSASVNAVPGEGWAFDHWEGDVPPEDIEMDPLSLLMDENKSVTAVFIPLPVTLTTHVDADGCEGCAVDPETADYVRDTPATVTATAGEGWKFDHWEGQVPGADIEMNPLALLMDSDKDITAVFVVKLTVEESEHATLDSPVLPLSWYFPGSSVDLSATPDTGYEIAFWEITVASTSGYTGVSQLESPAGGFETFFLPGPHVSFSILTPTLAFPHVRPIGTYYLHVLSDAVGEVDVDSDAPPISVDSGQSLYLFAPGVGVDLTASSSADGWFFKDWDGDIIPLAPESNPISLTMDRDRQVEANFSRAFVKIYSADIEEDSISFELFAPGHAGQLEMTLLGPGGSHVVRTVERESGHYNETLGRANLPELEFQSVRITWTIDGENYVDAYEHHFHNLGVYRHSVYNIPNESHASCQNGEVLETVHVTDGCIWTETEMYSTFAAAARLNGSGISLNHGPIQWSSWDFDNCPGRPANAQRDRTFRLQNAPEPACTGGSLDATTVAADIDSPVLDCGDEVFIVGPDVRKTVTDIGAFDPTEQLDNFDPNNGTCITGQNPIPDLGSFQTIKLFE